MTHSTTNQVVEAQPSPEVKRTYEAPKIELLGDWQVVTLYQSTPIHGFGGG